MVSAKLDTTTINADFFAEIDILSTSFVHQSVPHVDFSLKLQMPGQG